MERWRRHRRSVKLLVGATLLALLVKKFQIGEVLSHLREAPLAPLVSFFAFYTLASLFLSAASLHCLLRCFGRAPGALRDLLRNVPRVEFFALVVPAHLSDVGLVFLLDRHYERSKVLAAIFLDKVLSAAVVGALASLGVGMATGWRNGSGLLAVGLLGLWLLQRIVAPRDPRVGGEGTGPRRLLPAPLAAKISGFQGSLRTLLSHRRALLENLVLSLGKSLLYGAASVIGYRIFGYPVPVLYTVLSVAAAQLVALVPISANGLGVFEGMNILLMERAGVPPAAVLAFGLSGRFIHAGYLTLLNVILVWTDRQRVRA